MMHAFAYARASRIEEAVAALGDGCRPLAGGRPSCRGSKAVW